MVELFNLIFVESPMGLSILLLGAIVCFGIMGYESHKADILPIYRPPGGANIPVVATAVCAPAAPAVPCGPSRAEASLSSKQRRKR